MKKVLVPTAIILSVLAIAAGGYFAVDFSNSLFANETPAQAVETPPEVPATEQTLLDAVNAERAKVGVAALILNPDITKSAQLKADDMWDRDYRSHFLPEYGEQNITLTPEMASLIQPICSESSENFVYRKNDTQSVEEAMNWWLNSPPHKAAMLDPKYTYTGIGIGHDTIAVQKFCVAR